jgi:hypothetical protein
MENKRLQHAVKAMYRRLTTVDSDHPEMKQQLMPAAEMSTSLSPSLPVSPSPLPSTPPPLPPPFLLSSARPSVSRMSVGRKRPKTMTTSTTPWNDQCEVCAEEPARKKEVLFSGCLHGMCRSCMTAHLKARRRCCHICQGDFQGRLQELGVQVTIKHLLAESEKLR